MVPKVFVYEAVEYGLHTSISYELELPLPEFSSIDEVFGHLVCETKLLEPFYKGLLLLFNIIFVFRSATCIARIYSDGNSTLL
jgi:hypothetical protein